MAICESFLRDILWCSKSEQSTKVFSAKIVYFHNSRKLRISWFRSFVAINLWKFSPRNLGCGVLWRGKNKESANVFFVIFFTIRESFLPWKFPAIRYITFIYTYHSIIHTEHLYILSYLIHLYNNASTPTVYPEYCCWHNCHLWYNRCSYNHLSWLSVIAAVLP